MVRTEDSYSSDGGSTPSLAMNYLQLKQWACSLMVKYLVCNEKIRVQFTASPFKFKVNKKDKWKLRKLARKGL